MKFGKVFFETYCSNNFSGKTIVDVGAQDINGSLREFCPEGANYIGVDFVDGKGADIVLTDPYKLPFGDESTDVVVCSSVLEHSEFFWVLFLECIRVLRPDGLFYLNAPSNGYVHRFPVDSWRFYPDAGRSLVNWSRHNSYKTILLESFVGAKQGPIEGDGMWNDFVAVILKDQTSESLYPYRILDNEDQYFCDYNSTKVNEFPEYVQNLDHLLLTEQQTEIMGFKRTVTELDDLVDEREGQIASLCQAALEREGQIANLIAEINSIKASRSWKATAPIRWFHQKIKNLTS